MQRVLFICTHNSARSQMAEAFLNRLGGGEFEAESAGLAPTQVNPYVVEVMKEEGIDLSHKETHAVFDKFRQGRLYHYVITVCAEAESQCPIFPGVTHRLHLPFPDPASFTGSREDILARTREVRDAVKEKVSEFVAWCKEGCEGPLGDAWMSSKPA